MKKRTRYRCAFVGFLSTGGKRWIPCTVDPRDALRQVNQFVGKMASALHLERTGRALSKVETSEGLMHAFCRSGQPTTIFRACVSHKSKRRLYSNQCARAILKRSHQRLVCRASRIDGSPPFPRKACRRFERKEGHGQTSRPSSLCRNIGEKMSNVRPMRNILKECRNVLQTN